MPQAARAFAALTVAATVAGCAWMDDERESSLEQIRARPEPPPYFVGESSRSYR
jgi:hypothetical protein